MFGIGHSPSGFKDLHNFIHRSDILCCILFEYIMCSRNLITIIFNKNIQYPVTFSVHYFFISGAVLVILFRDWYIEEILLCVGNHVEERHIASS